MILEILAILFGLIYGSFANVLIYRIPLKMKVTDPVRSTCPSCAREIHWYDNIPVISWLLLRGKCRNCESRISISYPIIELLHGCTAFICLNHFGPNLTAFAAFLFCSTLIVITLIDLKHMIIPDRINKPGMLCGLLLGTVNQFYPLVALPFSQSLLDSAFGLALGYGFLYLVWWGYFKFSGVSALGGGDIKFLGFVGAMFGAEAIFPTILGSSLVGIIGAVASIISSKGNFRVEFPFGPWLAIAVAAYLFGFNITIELNLFLFKLLQ